MVRRLFTLDSNQLGRGPVVFAWRKDDNFIAVCGSNRRVMIVDRQGRAFHQVPLQGSGACLALEWDATGEILAIMQAGSSIVALWNFNTTKVEPLETTWKDLTWMKWSRTGPQLAIGTARGNLLLYNKNTHKKNPIMGKHTRKITCGAWSAQNILALGAEDKHLTLSDAEGDTTDQAHMKADPSHISFSDMKADDRQKGKENTVSVNLGGRTLLLYTLTDTENPIELAFQPKYGNISAYQWFGDGYVLIGFSSGYVVVISTHLKEIGQEVNSIQFHREKLEDVTYCPAVQKGASIGDNSVRIFEMSELSKMSEQRSETFAFDNEFGTLQRVAWTQDGQILSVSSKNGYLYTFLTRLSVLNDVYGCRVLFLTSLREMCVRDMVSEEDLTRIQIDVEPSFLSLGPGVCAVGMNDLVWYYSYSASASRFLGKRSYVSTIQSVKLSDKYAAVLIDGRVMLHQLDVDSEGGDGKDRPDITFPLHDENPDITAVVMTDDFLIYSTERGVIHYFSLDDWTRVNEHRHSYGIRSLYSNYLGTRLVLMDNQNEAWLYNPQNDHYLRIEGLSAATEKILWDTHEWGVFVAVDPQRFTTYVYSPHTRTGPNVKAVTARSGTRSPLANAPAPVVGEDGEIINITERPYSFMPVLCHNGNVVCQMVNGSMVTVQLQTHMYTNSTNTLLRLGGDQLYQAFYNNLALNRLEDAWKVATQLGLTECWHALANKALHILDVNMAARVYRQLNHPGVVMALEKLQDVHEKHLLLGHIAVLCKQFQDAQKHFLSAQCPKLALDLRRDLMQWEDALKLADQHAPELSPIIAREYAQQHEFNGKYQQALDMYEQGLRPLPDHEEDGNAAQIARLAASNRACTAGIARNSLRLGNVQKGVQMALESEDKELCAECAAILQERIPQWNDAAQLFEKAELFDKAIGIYIEHKALPQATKLLGKINNPKIFTRFAELMKAEGKFKESEMAYEKAGDWDAVVMMNLKHLNNLTKACTIVRKTKSTDAAGMVAKHCVQVQEIATAIEFLLMAKLTQEAFELAQRSPDNMAIYARVLGSNGRNEDYLAIANYYEKHEQDALAGDFFFKCNRYEQALRKYLECGTDQIQKAIDVVGKAHSDALTHKLIDFLMGGDSVPKEPHYIFKLYMALGNYDKAAKTAIIIAKQEQEVGNYRVAHQMLFSTHQDLVHQKIRIPSDLKRTLMLLHSYIIVKHLVKVMTDHETSARMLIRVSKNINKFPKHIVPILTSTVIECIKVGFKGSAVEYAGVLVRPEYRTQINEKYKKKIEHVVRKASNADVDPEEAVTPCPHCNTPVPETVLQCTSCKNNLPYCIITGKHMTKRDWSYCPSCHFPATHSMLMKYVESEQPCPMCEKPIAANQVKYVENPDPSALGGADEEDENEGR